jgi:hypothetical protein
MVSMSVLTLAACGSSSDNAYSQKSEAPMPPITEMDAAMEQPVPQPVGLNASDTLTPVAATPMAASSAAPMSADDRIAKLEQSVQMLQSDYQRIMPAFASLNTTNERIQVLLDELETQGKVPASASAKPVTIAAPTPAMKIAASEEEQSMVEPALVKPAASAPVVAPAAAPVQPDAATPAAGKPVPIDTGVTAVRIGEHANKTRIVFDLSANTKPAFTYDLDNAEKLMLVELPSASWAGKETGKPNSPLVAGWAVQKTVSGGSAVAIQLKKDARLLSTEFLKAEGKDPARLVIDIASGS